MFQVPGLGDVQDVQRVEFTNTCVPLFAAATQHMVRWRHFTIFMVRWCQLNHSNIAMGKRAKLEGGTDAKETADPGRRQQCQAGNSP